MKVGYNTSISNKAKIIGFSTEEPNIIIGDNSYIGDDVQIICDNFILGDYCKIHHHTNIHGKSVIIGHNAWIGQYTIIDGYGSTTINDNCGIGAHSQLWSHMRYGDTLEGCSWDLVNSLNIGKDVWLVGHCIVSPVTIEDKAMALVGSVITKDMFYNRTYAGSPAKDITDKFGSQFKEVTLENKLSKMIKYWLDFGANSSIKIIETSDMITNDYDSFFIVENRTYTKRNTKEEIDFMKFLLPTKAKFTPIHF